MKNISPEARAARKSAQLARLEAKTKPGYAEMYASQPAQVRKRAILIAQRQAAVLALQKADQQCIADAADAAATFSGVVSASTTQEAS